MFSVFSCSSWPPVCLLWRNVYLDLPPIFWLGIPVFFFFYAELHELLHILKINPLLVTSFADIFFLSVGSFHCERTLSPRGQFLRLIRLHFFIFVFIFITLGSGLEKIFLQFMSESILPMFFYNIFIVPVLHLDLQSIWNLCLCVVFEIVLILFFYMKLSSFPSTTYWRDYLFSIVYSCLFCHR